MRLSKVYVLFNCPIWKKYDLTNIPIDLVKGNNVHVVEVMSGFNHARSSTVTNVRGI